MTDIRDEFLSDEDLDLQNLSHDELVAYWNLWLAQAQVTNDLDQAFYAHGVFERDPAVPTAGESVRSPEQSRSVTPGARDRGTVGADRTRST